MTSMIQELTVSHNPFDMTPTMNYSNTTDSSFTNNSSTITNNQSYDGVDDFLLPWWQQTVFFLALIAILIIASGGNLIVIWIVLAHKRMRTVTNYFLVNLAIADFLISVLNMPFTFLFLLYQNWWFGTFFCKFSCFISPCTISVSVLTFMAIAIDRYMAILYPLRPRIPRRHVIAAIAVIWIISIALSLPNLIFFTTVEQSGVTLCTYTWSLDKDLAYNYLLLILNYIFPLLTLTITYSRVGIELWGSQAIGEETSVQHDRVKSKRKVVKMMIVVVIIFAVCWLPMHLYFLLSNHHPAVTKLDYIQQIYIVFFLMAMSNSMYNPIIYCWMNSRFREGFIRVFCWCPCRPCKKFRSKLRFRRTLFPTSVNAMSEKYSERNGSLMHTMTEYVDPDVNGPRRVSNNRNIVRKSDDYL
ncbi:tachykinin-like peptides receptor 99D isoform X2 [Ruditapes philippinarum]|nr:tachykinin-like peptides receptor 99D isoform X2 [Ruditapes philippinarum]XP_060604330.1 tachykinin-like peptides receptor 99D isoform X2 [Ruditapes philippinarum]XP_060604338.1 tachykinin-like peptides receptor 99D isoform X2 [Ruditapes philippinarum]XP_060604348.1 tachykinin-like peptides receptor 99D isoform X2 [Ruditapes philippinarum]XP_060604357.1 tachykinin-like peptides receptor 99D isoform X2 [Ruditapes philippinarum]